MQSSSRINTLISTRGNRLKLCLLLFQVVGINNAGVWMRERVWKRTLIYHIVIV